MKIVHLADVHLDRPFSGLPADLARTRRHELREAFRMCLQVANEHEADVVTISGDLWEDENVTADTRNFVSHELGRLAPTQVLMIAGNHDPLLPGGNYERTSWPENVHLFPSSEPTSVPLDGTGVVMWGASWTGGQLTADFLSTFNGHDDRTHVLLLHGTAQGSAFLAKDSHCPFDPGALERAGIAICLAGHIHAGWHAGCVVYPGSPEPLDWSETGRHCVAVVTVGEGPPVVELIDVNDRAVIELEVGCDDLASSAELDDAISRALDAAGDLLQAYVRVELTGCPEPECTIDTAAVTTRIEARCAGVRVIDRTRPKFDLEAMARGQTAEGRFVADILARVEAAESEEERETLLLAAEAGLRALRGEKQVLRVD